MVTTPLRRFGTLYDEIEKLNSTVSSDTYKVRKKFSGIYALKLFKKEFSDKKLKRQIDIYAHLGKEENPYFLKYISSSEDEMIVRDKYIVLELVEKGDLENFLLSGNYFSEKIAKFMIFKIILPIQQMHAMGIAHRNLSVKNILLDGSYNFKIAGFDHAILIKEDQKQIFKEDIINIGFLIIQLLTGKFNKKIIKQKMQLAIKKGNYELFWKVLEGQGEYNFSLELKDLINTILSEKIGDIETLLSHDWFDAVRKISQNEFILYEQLMKDELKQCGGVESD
jgi:serine/threonine protein kinase